MESASLPPHSASQRLNAAYGPVAVASHDRLKPIDEYPMLQKHIKRGIHFAMVCKALLKSTFRTCQLSFFERFHWSDHSNRSPGRKAFPRHWQRFQGSYTFTAKAPLSPLAPNSTPNALCPPDESLVHMAIDGSSFDGSCGGSLPGRG